MRFLLEFHIQNGRENNVCVQGCTIHINVYIQNYHLHKTTEKASRIK